MLAASMVAVACGDQVADTSCVGNGTVSVERCDGQDNDCDGDIDEGFPVGQDCILPSGCPGSRVCTLNGSGTECVTDVLREGREVCYGVDNDCDGSVDGYRVRSEVLSACRCDRRILALATLQDASHEAATACNVDGPTATLTTQVRCGQDGYALCTAEVEDFMDFDSGEGGRTLLEVSFELASDGPLRGAVNLWYEGTADPVVQNEPRKYVPLLVPGDAPGSYVRRFAPGDACFPKWVEDSYGCSGDRTECGACSTSDTCGSPVGSCESLSFARPRLQLAVEFCGGSDLSATVVLRQAAFLSSGCLVGGGE
jgi:hypothetical protein